MREEGAETGISRQGGQISRLDEGGGGWDWGMGLGSAGRGSKSAG